MDENKIIERRKILEAIVNGDCSDIGIKSCNECPYFSQKKSRCKLIGFGAIALLRMFEEE